MLHQVIDENKAVKKDKWVKDNQGQLIITAGQVVWTAECEKALSDPDEAKSALRHLKKKWISYLNKLTAITCSKLSKIERNKASAPSPSALQYLNLQFHHGQSRTSMVGHARLEPGLMRM